MDTITSDSGVKYDIVEEMGSRGSFGMYPTGRVYIQKSPSSSPETTDTPIENKQDFGEAIEIIRKFYISKLVAHQYSQHVHNVIYKKINDKYQRLLSILSSK